MTTICLAVPAILVIIQASLILASGLLDHLTAGYITRHMKAHEDEEEALDRHLRESRIVRFAHNLYLFAWWWYLPRSRKRSRGE